MTGITQPRYYRLDEYTSELHRHNLKLVRAMMMDCTISSIEVRDGDLQLNYIDGNIDIIQREEFIPRKEAI